MSLGTTIFSGAINFSAGEIVIALPTFFISTPNAANIFSVWSRDGAGSIIVVGLSAYSPAKIIADLTCALATGILYVMPRRFFFAAITVTGKFLFSLRPTIDAPISASG